MSWVGLEWPQADEELLAEAGAAWIKFGSEVGQVQGPVSQAAAGVWSQNTGDTSEAFKAWWNDDDGPPKRLSDDAAAAFLIGGALIAFSIVTLITKISIIVQLITLLILIAQAVITAFFTFGATAAEAPGFIAASRVLIKKLLTKLLEHVQTVVKDVLEKARNLLKMGKKIASREKVAGEVLTSRNPLADELAAQAEETLDGPNGGLGELLDVAVKDPEADKLAQKLGGKPSVRFTNGPDNEFDAVSDHYVAQTKPANFTLNKSFRNQAKTTFEVARQSGRTPYFHFDGPPGRGVVDALNRYAERYGVQPVIDIDPL